RAVHYLSTNECDVVGGPLKQEGKTTTGKAIAFCMSTKFGVGDTEFRTSNEKRIVQSVAFAVYKREIFEKVGLLDEQLVRNQDDELHYRINKFGYRIMMVPEMKCTYFVRESLIKLAIQYFQYGLYKPLVFKKVKSGFRARHFVPSLFVLYLLFTPLAFYFPLFIIPAILYFAADIFFSFNSKNSIAIKFNALLVYPVLHLAYGTGFLVGLGKRNK
ncbi:MAG: glycosyltransferase family 2 protein, partial [Bacteroidia bacterium]|nr:glycosyltransferase family 2 protein [Bacteroidia bacterium]